MPQSDEGQNLRQRKFSNLSLVCDMEMGGQTEVNDHPASFESDVVSIGFLNLYYRYKSIATQITQDAGLAMIPCTDRKVLPHGYITSVASRCTS